MMAWRWNASTGRAIDRPSAMRGIYIDGPIAPEDLLAIIEELIAGIRPSLRKKGPRKRRRKTRPRGLIRVSIGPLDSSSRPRGVFLTSAELHRSLLSEGLRVQRRK